MRAGAGCLALMWRSASTPMTRPTPASGPTGSSAWFTDPVARPSSDGRAQSNQFQRAVDLARRFLHAGLPVCIGGFHVSGSIAMLATMPAEMREGAALGISFFAGAAEHGRLDPIIRDAWDGSLLPLYNYISDLPSLEGEPAPILPRKHVRRVSGQLSSLGLGRGCPYQCSFCTIINVQGRKSRFRTPDDLEQAIRENYRQGNRRFFITDDKFARNRHWEPLFDRMIQLRVGGRIKDRLHDPGRHVVPPDPELHREAAQAGVRRVFIGLENINPDNLAAAKKRHSTKSLRSSPLRGATGERPVAS